LKSGPATFEPGPKGEIGPIQIRPPAVKSLKQLGILPANYGSDVTANLTAGGLFYSAYLIEQKGIPATQAAAAYNGGETGYKTSVGAQAYQSAFNQKVPLFQKLVDCLK
jgi:hypothetical protein